MGKGLEVREFVGLIAFVCQKINYWFIFNLNLIYTNHNN